MPSIDLGSVVGPQGAQGPQGIQGVQGDSAGFGTPTVTVDNTTGTPSASVSASGPDTAKVFAFSFSGLKGETAGAFYGTSSTATSTKAKTVTVDSSFTLTPGVMVVVQFANTSTADAPTLNVNSTGAKPIYFGGEAIPRYNYLIAGRDYPFIYDGTNWNLVGSTGSYITAGRKSGTTLGRQATAEGNSSMATQNYSHAEGYGSVASGYASHAGGRNCFAGRSAAGGSHAMGMRAIAAEQKQILKIASYSKDDNTITFDTTYRTFSTAFAALSIGGILLITYGTDDPAAGFYTIASIDASANSVTLNESLSGGSFAYALNCSAAGSGYFPSFAEGKDTIATGNASHAEGYNTTAFGAYSHAGGNSTIANAAGQTAIGAFNISSNDATDKLIIGNGTSDSARSNCFRVTHTGVFASGEYSSSGADYAELFEWEDGNPAAEDRVGRFVTLDGEKIRLAGPSDDFILGIITGNPSVLGDVYDDQWNGMYLTDVFGRPIWEDVEVPDETEEIEIPAEIDPDTGEEISPAHTEKRVLIPAYTERRQKLNPAYDSSQPYRKRTERPEWGAVGMLGKLVVIDDGTCQVNGWAAVGEDGLAVRSDDRTKYRVLSRIDSSHVRVLLLGG